MTLVKRNTNGQFPSLLDEFLKTDWFGGTTNNFALSAPAVNIIERKDAFAVQVAAPGLKKEDFNIELDNEMLTISVSQDAEVKQESGKYTRKEFNYTSFKRTFNLPETINNAEIKAAYTAGILEVALPKREEAKTQPKRLIDIS